MNTDPAFQQALNETMPPMDEAAKLRWWFDKGTAAANERIREIEAALEFERAQHVKSKDAYHTEREISVKLEKALNDQLNDCINFDGGKLTDFIMEASTSAIAVVAAIRAKENA